MFFHSSLCFSQWEKLLLRWIIINQIFFDSNGCKVPIISELSGLRTVICTEDRSCAIDQSWSSIGCDIIKSTEAKRHLWLAENCPSAWMRNVPRIEQNPRHSDVWVNATNLRTYQEKSFNTYKLDLFVQNKNVTILKTQVN